LFLVVSTEELLLSITPDTSKGCRLYVPLDRLPISDSNRRWIALLTPFFLSSLQNIGINGFGRIGRYVEGLVPYGQRAMAIKMIRFE